MSERFLFRTLTARPDPGSPGCAALLGLPLVSSFALTGSQLTGPGVRGVQPGPTPDTHHEQDIGDQSQVAEAQRHDSSVQHGDRQR